MAARVRWFAEHTEQLKALLLEGKTQREAHVIMGFSLWQIHMWSKKLRGLAPAPTQAKHEGTPTPTPLDRAFYDIATALPPAERCPLAQALLDRALHLSPE